VLRGALLGSKAPSHQTTLPPSSGIPLSNSRASSHLPTKCSLKHWIHTIDTSVLLFPTATALGLGIKWKLYIIAHLVSGKYQ